jgi:methionyl-tRNA formyltransferase
VLRLVENFPVDFSFVIDFGQLIREPVLAWDEPVGCLNIHPSALPLYRGAAPVQRALIDGRSETGVTVFKLAAGMDSGPILLREKIGIKDDDAGRLLDRAAVVGTSAFIKYASEHPIEEWIFEPQDDSLATIAPKIRQDEERIDWGSAAMRICGLVRALSPKPGAWTTVRGRRLKVLDASVLDSSNDSGVANGALLGVCEDGVLVSARDNSVLLRTVQMEGKKIQSALEWWNGLRATREEQLL